MIILQFPRDGHRSVLVSTQGGQGQQNRANARREFVSISKVSAAVLRQDSPQLFPHRAISSHPGVTRDLTAQTQNPPIAMVDEA